MKGHTYKQLIQYEYEENFQENKSAARDALIGVTVQAQKSPQDMDRFIDALMRRMTVEEKIGSSTCP